MHNPALEATCGEKPRRHLNSTLTISDMTKRKSYPDSDWTVEEAERACPTDDVGGCAEYECREDHNSEESRQLLQ